MKAAKTLITVGTVIRLVIGILFVVASVITFLLWMVGNPNGGDSLFYGQQQKSWLTSTIVLVAIGMVLIIASIVGFCTLKRLHKTWAIIVNMVLGIMTIPVGLFCLFGGKAALNCQTQWAKENLDPERAGKIERHNKAIWSAFLGMLLVYAMISVCMFILNLGEGFLGASFSIDGLKNNYQKIIFPGSSSAYAGSLSYLSLAVLIPLIVGYFYSAILGCCPSFASRHLVSQFVVYGICYLASAVIYVIFLVNYFQNFDAIASNGLTGNVNIYRVIGAAAPLLLFVCFNLPMYLMAFIPPFVRIEIWNARNKEPKEGFSFLAAFLTLVCFLLGLFAAEKLFFFFVELILNLIDAIIGLISAIVGFALAFCLIIFVLSFFPNRVTKITFDDGSYYTIEEYGSGSGGTYAKGEWHNANGTVNVNDHADYYSGDDLKNLNDYVDRHK